MFAEDESVWVKALVALVFFIVAPAIKGILDSRKKKELELERRARTSSTSDEAGDTARDEAREDETEGRRAWEALLRGETPATATPEPPPVVVRERISRRTLDPSSPSKPYSPSANESVTSVGSQTVEDEDELTSDARRSVLTESKALTESEPLTNTKALTESPALTDSPALTESAALTDAPATEGVTLADLVAQKKFGDLAVAPALGGARKRGRPVSRAAIGSIAANDDWRRAVVLSEILAPPVSMRPPHIGPF